MTILTNFLQITWLLEESTSFSSLWLIYEIEDKEMGHRDRSVPLSGEVRAGCPVAVDARWPHE